MGFRPSEVPMERSQIGRIRVRAENEEPPSQTSAVVSADVNVEGLLAFQLFPLVVMLTRSCHLKTLSFMSAPSFAAVRLVVSGTTDAISRLSALLEEEKLRSQIALEVEKDLTSKRPL